MDGVGSVKGTGGCSFQAEYQKGETGTRAERSPGILSTNLLNTDQRMSLRKLAEGEERTNQIIRWDNSKN